MRSIRLAVARDRGVIRTTIGHPRAARNLLSASGVRRAAGPARHVEHRLRRSQP